MLCARLVLDGVPCGAEYQGRGCPREHAPEAGLVEAWFDGGGKGGNPGTYAGGAVVRWGPEDEALRLRHCGETTNNVAEWAGCVIALQEIARRMLESYGGPIDVVIRGEWFNSLERWRRVTVYGDSELVIDQLRGVKGMGAPHLVQSFVTAQDIVKSLRALGIEVNLVHIPREFNKRADGVVRDVMAGREVPGLVIV